MTVAHSSKTRPTTTPACPGPSATPRSAHAPRARRAVQATSLKMIAEAVGVSQTTVSRVLNNSQIPSPATREKVLKAVAELNYQPDPVLGQAVRRRRMGARPQLPTTQTAGFLTNELSFEAIQMGDTFYSSVMMGAQATLARANHHMMLAAAPSASMEIPALVSERRVDGLLISCDLHPVALEYLASQMPMVFMGRNAPHSITGDSVCSDAYLATTTQLRYLYELGHRRIVFFEQAALGYVQQQRQAAYRDFLQQVGLANLLHHPLNQLQPTTPATHYQVIADYVEALLADPTPPTALIAQDTYAINLMQALQQRQVRVPEQISVCGVHEHGKGEFASPALTSYRVPMEQVGQNAARFLLDRMENPKCPSRRLAIAGQQVIRASCAAPRS